MPLLLGFRQETACTDVEEQDEDEDVSTWTDNFLYNLLIKHEVNELGLSSREFRS